MKKKVPKSYAVIQKNNKNSTILPKLILATVTLINLTLTLILCILRRKDTIRAIKNEDGNVEVLLTKVKTQKGLDEHLT